MIILFVSLATLASTLFGGLFALRFKDQLHLVLGFSAGAVIGVAFFDLLPEAMSIGTKFYSTEFIASIIALGFSLYLLIDRTTLLHFHHHEGHDEGRGVFGAGSLSLHSFLDGIAIGLAFQVSVAIGSIVAIAVLVHDFSDGINTVSMILRNNGSKKQAFRWLLVDALAPTIGIFSTFFFTLSEQFFGPLLALFCGFFLYIGASDLLPESHHIHPTIWTTFMSVLGMAVLYCAIRLIAF